VSKFSQNFLGAAIGSVALTGRKILEEAYLFRRHQGTGFFRCSSASGYTCTKPLKQDELPSILARENWVQSVQSVLLHSDSSEDKINYFITNNTV